jgi:hypothetical protein
MTFLPRGRKKDDDDSDGLFHGVHPTDLGVVIVALAVTFGFFYMLLVPQNWSAIDRAMAPDPPKPPPQVHKKGETQMLLFDAQKE